jgi:hypothetical protein
VSDIEKKIMEKNQFFEKRKKVLYKESDFKWWHYNDKESYFVLTTEERVLIKRENRFIIAMVEGQISFFSSCNNINL